MSEFLNLYNPGYDKSDLVKNFIRDIIHAIKQHKPKFLSFSVSNIFLCSDFIKFIFRDPLYLTFNILNDLNIIWKERIFEGSAGYYNFGDILNNSIIEYDQNKSIKTIQLPFYKTNTLELYFDIVPKELFVIIITNLDYDSLNNILTLYPQIKNDDNVFKIMMSIKYSKIFTVFNSVYNDVKTDWITWKHVYSELVKLQAWKCFDDVTWHSACVAQANAFDMSSVLEELLEEDNFDLIKETNMNELTTRALIKLHYPSIYDKIDFNIDEVENYYDELICVDKDSHLFYYIKNGKFPEGYLLSYYSINDNPYLLYLLLSDKNIEYISDSDYIELIILIMGYNDLSNKWANLVFSMIGLDELQRISKLNLNDDMYKKIDYNSYKELVEDIKYYLDNLIKL